MLGDLGNRLHFVMKYRVPCCPTVSLKWEEFFVFFFFVLQLLSRFTFYVCVLGQNGWARTSWWCVCYGDMIVRFWWPAMTSLMCFTFWCLLFVSVLCIAFLVGSMSFSPVTLFATPSGGERLYPYLFTCHVSTGHLFLWPYLWFYVVMLVFLVPFGAS